MRKLVFATALTVFFLSPGVRAQTTAMDFNMPDCSGRPHHLYSELDSGYVIVIDYIMLSCSPCIIATNGLKGILNQFQTSHPGKVRLYTFGYLDIYTCQQLESWRTSNSFAHPTFNNGNAQVNYYGGMGMPTIVVLSGNGYKVEYRKLGYSSADDNAIIAAINKGLASATGIGDNTDKSSQGITVSTESGIVTVKHPDIHSGIVSLYDLKGAEIAQQRLSGSGVSVIPSEGLSEGLYLLNVRSAEGFSESLRFILTK